VASSTGTKRSLTATPKKDHKAAGGRRRRELRGRSRDTGAKDVTKRKSGLWESVTGKVTTRSPKIGVTIKKVKEGERKTNRRLRSRARLYKN